MEYLKSKHRLLQLYKHNNRAITAGHGTHHSRLIKMPRFSNELSKLNQLRLHRTGIIKKHAITPGHYALNVQRFNKHVPCGLNFPGSRTTPSAQYWNPTCIKGITGRTLSSFKTAAKVNPEEKKFSTHICAT